MNSTLFEFLSMINTPKNDSCFWFSGYFDNLCNNEANYTNEVIKRSVKYFVLFGWSGYHAIEVFLL